MNLLFFSFSLELFRNKSPKENLKLLIRVGQKLGPTNWNTGIWKHSVDAL